VLVLSSPACAPLTVSPPWLTGFCVEAVSGEVSLGSAYVRRCDVKSGETVLAVDRGVNRTDGEARGATRRINEEDMMHDG